MLRLYRVVYFSGEYCDMELDEEKAEQYYCDEEVKIITPLINDLLLVSA